MNSIQSLLIFLKFFYSPTLYIGEHSHGLYALPSFADSSTAKIISSKGARLLLEGPLVTSHISTNENGIPLPGDHVPSTIIETSDNDFQSINSEKSIIMLGKYYAILKLKIIPSKPIL